MSLGQLRGSHSIAQISDAVVALERDEQSETERSDTTLRVIKDRYSGQTGIACKLTYDLSSCRFNENETTESSFLRGTSKPAETTDF